MPQAADFSDAGANRLHPAPRRADCGGFTLVELMVAITILGILAAMALPSMEQFVTKTKVNAIARDFTNSLAYARNEAISRSTRIVLCPRSTTNMCHDTQYWGQFGWVMFVDKNYNNVRDAGEELIRAYDAVDPTGNRYRLVNQSPSKFVRFNADGNTGQLAATFDLTVSGSSDAPERSICIAVTGRARVIDYTGASCV